MSRKKVILLTVGAILISFQFYPLVYNDDKRVTSVHFTMVYAVPENVQAMLKNSCYNCHSNSTNYPWYAYVQPFGWFLASHINEGKSELNLSEFGGYSPRRQKSKLKSMAGSVRDGSMPISSYTMIGRNARLRESGKKILLDWLNTTRQALTK